MKSLVLFFALAAAAFGAESRVFRGVITDNMCKPDHKIMKMGSDPECVRGCIRAHAGKYALFDGKKTWVLSDQKKPEPFAGQKVIVRGVLYEKTGILKLESIERDK